MTGDVVELSKDDLYLAEAIGRLFESGHLTIVVNIEPEYAKYGEGQWNVTKTYIKVADKYIPLEDGRVEIIEGR